VTDQFEIGPAQKVPDVLLGPGEEIVQAHDVVPLFHQPITKVGPQKPCAAGHEYAFVGMPHLSSPLITKSRKFENEKFV
jgi:hypothetical protein